MEILRDFKVAFVILFIPYCQILSDLRFLYPTERLIDLR